MKRRSGCCTTRLLTETMEKLICSAAEFSAVPEELLRNGAELPLFVSGNSMNPFLIDGRDIVFLRVCTQADFSRGNIILYRRSDSSLVLHRIKKVLPDGMLLMNGDAQTWCEKIKQSQAVAVVCSVERDGNRKNANCFYLKMRNSLWQLLMPVRSHIMRLWRRFKSLEKQ